MRHVTNSIDYIDSLVRAEEFFARYPDRGVPYTPVLLGLDWLHGTRGLEAQNPFFYTCGGSPRLYTMVMMGLETLLPSRSATPDDDTTIRFIERDNYSLSGSSFGDVFDIMVVNPPSESATLEKLNAYKAMVLLGEIRWTKPLAERLKDYVMAGGTLFLAADQLAASPDMGWCGIAVGDKTAESRATCDQQGKLIDTLPEGYTQLVHELVSTVGTETLFADEERRPLVVRRAVGKGNVLVCLVPSMLDKKAEHTKVKVVSAARETLQMLHDQSLPFKIEGDVEFCINRRSTSWVITLINNRGIYKDMKDLVAKVDEGKKALVTITSKIPVRNAVERLAGDKVELTRKNKVVKQMTITIPPGDVRIVEVSE